MKNKTIIAVTLAAFSFLPTVANAGSTGTLKAVAFHAGNPVLTSGTWTFCKDKKCFNETGGSTKEKNLSPGIWSVRFTSETLTGQRNAFVRAGTTNNTTIKTGTK